jgi:hypothetical protein
MRPAAILVLAFALAGCAGASAPADSDQPVIYPVLSPDSLGRSLVLSQIVTGEYGEERHTLRVEIEVTRDRLVVVGLTPLGVPLFSFEQKAGSPTIDMTEVPDQVPFDPRHMLSDLQLAYWPTVALTAALARKGLKLEDGREDGFRRVVDRDGRLLVDILYVDPGTDRYEIVIQHFDHPYRLRIRTIDGKTS